MLNIVICAIRKVLEALTSAIFRKQVVNLERCLQAKART